MAEYEIVNEETGEIQVFKTSVNIQQLEDYNNWVIDRRLNPPTFSPQEYAEHIESENAKTTLFRAKEFAWSLNEEFVDELFIRLRDILDGKE